MRERAAPPPRNPEDTPPIPAPDLEASPEDPTDLPLDRLGLSTRARNMLGRVGILTLRDVSALHENELRAVPNLGEKTLREVVDKLAEHGLTTRETEARIAPDRLIARPESHRAPREGALGAHEERRDTQRAPVRDARLDEMVRLREEGRTLAEIAETFGVTRERVRQMLRAAGTSVDAEAARSAQRAEAARRVSGELLAGFRAGRASKDVARELGVTVSAANEVLREHVTASDRAERSRELSRRRGHGTYSREDLIQAVQEVARRIGRVPTSNDYSEEASRSGLPSLPTLTNRLGGWTNAVRAAGMTPHKLGRRNYERRWTEDSCWAALQRVVSELGEVPTVGQYDLLASADDDLPSLATVRNRLGRWSEVTARLSVDPHPDPILRDLGISPRAADHERDEAIWLAHLEGDVTDEEIEELMRRGLFTWDPSYGPRPGT